MGLKLLWRIGDSCGLGMENDITEVVLTSKDNPFVQFKVESVDKVLPDSLAAGGKVAMDLSTSTSAAARSSVIRGATHTAFLT